MKRMVFSAIILTGLVLFINIAAAAERHVPSEYSTIQAAINACSNGDVVIIAPGTYTGTGNRDINFNGKAITVRSNDSNDNDVVTSTIIDCENLGRAFQFSHYENYNSRIEGIYIVNGRSQKGSAIYCSGASPAIKNCFIVFCGITGGDGSTGQNGQDVYGGGIYCEAGGGTPWVTLINCTFYGNIIQGGAGGPSDTWLFIPPGDGGNAFGGAVYAGTDCSIYAYNCNFISNVARGGAVYDEPQPIEYGASGNALGGGLYGRILLSGSVLYDNSAIGGASYSFPIGGGSGLGGGIYATEYYNYFSNCLIVQNSTVAGGVDGFSYGGGIHSASSEFTAITNSSICDNTVDTNGAYGYGGGGIYGNSDTLIIDSILWGNIDDLWGCTATFSCIKDPDPGDRNIHSDPCFVSGGPYPSQQYFLAHTATGQASNSPCIDAGSDYSVILGFWNSSTRTDMVADNGIVDMGYHWGSNDNSMPSDLNNDCAVNFVDFAILASQWKQAPGTPSADIAPPGDGIVDWNDLELMAQSWLWTCSY